MIDGIPISFEGLSGWGVVGVIVLLLLTGKGGIALRREVTVAERSATQWEAAFRAERAISQEKDERQAELLELARAADRVLTALDDARQAQLRGETT